MSNLARVVVIIWVFVVLILQSSYTASLTSLLTVEQFEPSYTHISELKDNGERVGYLKDSFVKGFLVKTWKFDQEKLIPFRSPQEYAEALAKGSRNGGVAAIIDEIPYLKVFLKDHCDNYTMAGQTYKTSGFGFVSIYTFIPYIYFHLYIFNLPIYMSLHRCSQKVHRLYQTSRERY